MQRRLIYACAASWAVSLVIVGAVEAGWDHHPILGLSLALSMSLLVTVIVRPRIIAAGLIFDLGVEEGRRQERERRAAMASVVPFRDLSRR